MDEESSFSYLLHQKHLQEAHGVENQKMPSHAYESSMATRCMVHV